MRAVKIKHRPNRCSGRSLLMICLLLAGFQSAPLKAASSQPLMLCGEGELTAYLIFKVGTARLYRNDCHQPWPPQVSERTKLVFTYSREIPAKAFRQAAEHYLEKNGIPMTSDLKALNAAYQPVNEGDSYTLLLTPGRGLALLLNGQKLMAIPDTPAAQAYFSIWLGAAPFNETLKKALLGEGSHKANMR